MAVVDRIEDEFVILEWPGGASINIPRSLAPGIGEGDVVTVELCLPLRKSPAAADAMARELERLFNTETPRVRE